MAYYGLVIILSIVLSLVVYGLALRPTDEIRARVLGVCVPPIVTALVMYLLVRNEFGTEPLVLIAIVFPTGTSFASTAGFWFLIAFVNSLPDAPSDNAAKREQPPPTDPNA